MPQVSLNNFPLFAHPFSPDKFLHPRIDLIFVVLTMLNSFFRPKLGPKPRGEIVLKKFSPLCPVDMAA